MNNNNECITDNSKIDESECSFKDKIKLFQKSSNLKVEQRNVTDEKNMIDVYGANSERHVVYWSKDDEHKSKQDISPTSSCVTVVQSDTPQEVCVSEHALVPLEWAVVKTQLVTLPESLIIHQETDTKIPESLIIHQETETKIPESLIHQEREAKLPEISTPALVPSSKVLFSTDNSPLENASTNMEAKKSKSLIIVEKDLTIFQETESKEPSGQSSQCGDSSKMLSAPIPRPMPPSLNDSFAPSFSDNVSTIDILQKSTSVSNESTKPDLLHMVSSPPPPPPPPGLSSVPPPPPPPMAIMPLHHFAQTQKNINLRKKKVTPAVPMKTLYWNRIVLSDIKEEVQTLWAEIEEVELDNMERFSELFAVQKNKESKSKKSLSFHFSESKLLDQNRAKSVGILQRFLLNKNISIGNIQNAAYSFNTSEVSYELLKQIHKERPTKDEIERIKKHVENSENSLSKTEQFLLDLSEIALFSEIMRCYMFREHYTEDFEKINANINAMNEVCEFLMTNTNLKKILSIILTLGNYMNGGNATKGQADGFSIELLPKLRRVASKNPSISLLHYIIEMYDESFECRKNAVFPIPELMDFIKVSQIKFGDLECDLSKWERKYEELGECIVVICNSEVKDERTNCFYEGILPFIESCNEQLDCVKENFTACRERFVKTVNYFMFKPKLLPIDDCASEFFEPWLDFCVDFKQIWSIGREDHT